MSKTFNIPFLFILIFLISKEIFSYDGEKVVILCILSFAFIAYYNLRTAIYEGFLATSSKIEEELNILINLREKLENNIHIFWNKFLILENLLIEIYIWVKFNFKNFIQKANKNRILFNFHIIKDQLNSLVKETLLTQYLMKSMKKAIILNNFYFMLNSNLNTNAIKFPTFIKKPVVNFGDNNDFHSADIILNKLNINKDVVVNTNSYKIETLLLLGIKF